MDGLDSTTGVVALAAAAGSLIALLLTASTALRLRRLRRDQLAILGGSQKGDLVAHAAAASRRVDSIERALQVAVETLVKRANQNELDLRESVAHTAVIRYDALNEGTGRQSSSIALLDREGRGVVISSIHQREQARVYAKPIEAWRSEFDLSPEEQEALDAAAGRGRGRGIVKVSFLGPAGSFSEEALSAALGATAAEVVASPTIFHAIDAVERGEVERGFVPFENSIEGTVRSTLDALAFDADGVEIVGEYDHPIRNNLIAREQLELSRIEAVVSHPQANAQCAGFLRTQLPGAQVLAAASTSDAVRQVSESDRPWAALGSAAAAAAFDCVILRAGVEDAEGNLTRFVWLAPVGAVAGTGPGDFPIRTTLVFSELGGDRPGVLVDALAEFSNRGVNMTRIESRPMRQGLGRYLFFLDIDDAAGEALTIEAIEALRAKAETVRVLGRYPVGGPPPL